MTGRGNAKTTRNNDWRDESRQRWGQAAQGETKENRLFLGKKARYLRDFKEQGKCCAPARCAALLILTLSCHWHFLWYKSQCRSIKQPLSSLKSVFCMRSVRGAHLTHSDLGLP